MLVAFVRATLNFDCLRMLDTIFDIELSGFSNFRDLVTRSASNELLFAKSLPMNYTQSFAR